MPLSTIMIDKRVEYASRFKGRTHCFCSLNGTLADVLCIELSYNMHS